MRAILLVSALLLLWQPPKVGGSSFDAEDYVDVTLDVLKLVPVIGSGLSAVLGSTFSIFLDFPEPDYVTADEFDAKLEEVKQELESKIDKSIDAAILDATLRQLKEKSLNWIDSFQDIAIRGGDLPTALTTSGECTAALNEYNLCQSRTTELANFLLANWDAVFKDTPAMDQVLEQFAACVTGYSLAFTAMRVMYWASSTCNPGGTTTTAAVQDRTKYLDDAVTYQQHAGRYYEDWFDWRSTTAAYEVETMSDPVGGASTWEWYDFCRLDSPPHITCATDKVQYPQVGIPECYPAVSALGSTYNGYRDAQGPVEFEYKFIDRSTGDNVTITGSQDEAMQNPWVRFDNENPTVLYLTVPQVANRCTRTSKTPKSDTSDADAAGTINGAADFMNTVLGGSDGLTRYMFNQANIRMVLDILSPVMYIQFSSRPVLLSSKMQKLSFGPVAWLTRPATSDVDEPYDVRNAGGPWGLATAIPAISGSWLTGAAGDVEPIQSLVLVQSGSHFKDSGATTQLLNTADYDVPDICLLTAKNGDPFTGVTVTIGTGLSSTDPYDIRTYELGLFHKGTFTDTAEVTGSDYTPADRCTGTGLPFADATETRAFSAPTPDGVPMYVLTGYTPSEGTEAGLSTATTPWTIYDFYWYDCTTASADGTCEVLAQVSPSPPPPPPADSGDDDDSSDDDSADTGETAAASGDAASVFFTQSYSQLESDLGPEGAIAVFAAAGIGTLAVVGGVGYVGFRACRTPSVPSAGETPDPEVEGKTSDALRNFLPDLSKFRPWGKSNALSA